MPIYHPPPIFQNNSRRHMHPVVNNYFSQHQSSLVRVKYHHKQDLLITTKQDFSLLAPTSNYKVIKFSPQVSLNVNRTNISPTTVGCRTPGLTDAYVLYTRQTDGKHVRVTNSTSRSGIQPKQFACMPKFDFYVKLNS